MTRLDRGFVSDEQFARLRELRATRPSAIAEALATRTRRPVLSDAGRLFIVAADHPARGALGIGDDPMAMADRYDLLDRLALALSRPGVDGVLGTPDIIDDLALLGALDGKVVVGSMNRGGIRLFVCAHIHLPYVRYIDGRCIVNTGSVGLPFDGLPQASYALVEAEEDRFRVTIERVPYDVEKVVKQYRDCEYPNADLLIRVVREAKSPAAR